MSSELSDHDRHSIVALSLYAGWSNKAIANKLKCSESTVSRTLKRWNDTGDVQDRPRSGRPPLIDISDANNNPITNSIRKRRNSNSKMIKKELLDNYNINLSLRTISHLRQKLKFKHVRFRRVPHLSETNKEKRLEYVINCEGEDWKDIIFTDESKFEVGNGRGLYYKHRNSPAEERSIKQHPVSVMAWGGIWIGGRTKLEIIEDTVDSEEYCNILYKHFVENEQDEYKQILQDGAPAHTSRFTQSFIDNFGLYVRQNPPQSPDLNPIEKVWGWMKREQSKLDPQTRDELVDVLNTLWNEMDQSLIDAFIQHNTVVCEKIKQANGGNI